MRFVRTIDNQNRRNGQSLVEFALVLPIFVVLLFGLVDIERLFNSWVTIEAAAREAARYGVTGRVDCDIAPDNRLGCIEYYAERRAESLSDSETNLEVSVRSWQYPDYADPPATGNPGEQCDALEVQVEYDFSPSTPLIGNIMGSVHLTVGERMVNEPFGPCTEE